MDHAEEEKRAFAELYWSNAQTVENQISNSPENADTDVLGKCEHLVLNSYRLYRNIEAETDHIGDYHVRLVRSAQELQALTQDGFPEEYPTDLDGSEIDDMEMHVGLQTN